MFDTNYTTLDSVPKSKQIRWEAWETIAVERASRSEDRGKMFASACHLPSARFGSVAVQGNVRMLVTVALAQFSSPSEVR